ncbi:MAG TPA: alpha-glucan family phosphorylase [Acidobacteriota bacterium]|nr:alpha-glucan family phosphorylase [Acidobacteriota bacterium]
MTLPTHPLRTAYFSMEIALRAEIPTYAGGLGILAGDMLRSAADVGLPVVGVTLLYRKDYFQQHLDQSGNQTESPALWNPEAVLQPSDARASIVIEGRKVIIRAWEYSIKGLGGYVLPVILLDTALPENSPFDQTLTDQLYGGDEYYRLCQEAVLGIGGMEILSALGCWHIVTFHMNEGHASLLTLALLEAHLAARQSKEVTPEGFDFLRRKCVFTTHTPVPAGHDQFPRDLVRRVLGDERVALLEKIGGFTENTLNMTFLGLRGSHYINGVAMKHGEVSRSMFPNYPIHAITNGVHATTWTSPPFQELFDRHIPEWRRDNLYLRYAIGIPLQEIRAAHTQAKRTLLDEIELAIGVRLDEKTMTMGFARRAATYKRADFLFSNTDRLKWIAQHVGPFQVVYSGKAHPHDEAGKDLIRHIFAQMAALKEIIRIVYIPDYDMRWGQLITSGADLWLNTPQRPFEASGTSGMKAALNGVPSLSVPDGWWREGHVEGATGWDIGEEEIPDTPAEEMTSLYHKLENIILPMFYGRKDAYAEVMRLSIALNGSFFNTQRMVAQYIMNVYFSGTQEASIQQVIEEVRRT